MSWTLFEPSRQRARATLGKDSGPQSVHVTADFAAQPGFAVTYGFELLYERPRA